MWQRRSMAAALFEAECIGRQESKPPRRDRPTRRSWSTHGQGGWLSVPRRCVAAATPWLVALVSACNTELNDPHIVLCKGTDLDEDGYFSVEGNPRCCDCTQPTPRPGRKTATGCLNQRAPTAPAFTGETWEHVIINTTQLRFAMWTAAMLFQGTHFPPELIPLFFNGVQSA